MHGHTSSFLFTDNNSSDGVTYEAVTADEARRDVSLRGVHKLIFHSTAVGELYISYE